MDVAEPRPPWRERAAVSMGEAADLLGCTRQHLWNLQQRGGLRSVRLGRRIVIPTSEILRLVGEESGGADTAS